jgi:hypothetical protein
VPDGIWLCPACLAQGFTALDAAAREAQREELADRESAPVLFPDAATKKRDQAAEAKQGRLVKKTFNDPSTGQPRQFWGRVHYLGPLSRPNYYHIVYEDGDTEIMGNRKLNQILQPEEVQLPAGVSIPMPVDPIAAAAQVFSSAPMQQVVRDRGFGTISVPAAPVPISDLQQLTRLISIGLAQYCWDPITCSDLWRSYVHSVPCYCQPNLPAGVRPSSAVILTAPVVQYILHAVKQALQCKPAAIVCYVPTAWIPSPVWQLLQALKQQQRAAMFRVSAGWWLVISRPALPVRHWLR